MARKIYIKFSNGSTTQLIDMYDEARQNEAIENGFLMVPTDEGLPATIDSSDLITTADLSRAQMLRAISERHRVRNEAISAQSTLSQRFSS